MYTLFVVCAAIGGTILILQLLLTLIGFGGHSFGFEAPHDIGHDFGGHDVAGDTHGTGGHHAGADQNHAGSLLKHGSTWLFGVISFRTVVAALAFFGLAGLAAQSAHLSARDTLGIAMAAGFAAMYGVYAMMRWMNSLRADGTIRIQRAIGHEATVYLTIPPAGAGSGKIQINLQNRTMEYLATSTGDAIPTGATVIVTDVIGLETVQVRPASPQEHLPSESASHV